MTAALSHLVRPADIAIRFDRPQKSIAHRLDDVDVTDGDIRNLVEGFRTEGDVLDEAERCYEDWWKRLDPRERASRDFCALWPAFKAGWLSMARELGQLPLARSV